MASSPIFLFMRAIGFSTEEFQELLSDDAGDAFGTSRLRKTMRGSVDRNQFDAGRYQLDCSLQFLNRAEDVLGTADE